MSDDVEPTSPEALRRVQFDEADEIKGAPTFPVMTGSQWKGMIRGGLGGAVIGAVVALPFGFIPFSGLDLAIRILIVVVAGAAAGAAAGGVYFGGRMPELTGESADDVTLSGTSATRSDAVRSDGDRHVG